MLKNNVSRIDYARIDNKFIDKSTGFVKIPGYPTRTGVFTYKKADGSVAYDSIEELLADVVGDLGSDEKKDKKVIKFPGND